MSEVLTIVCGKQQVTLTAARGETEQRTNCGDDPTQWWKWQQQQSSLIWSRGWPSQHILVIKQRSHSEADQTSQQAPKWWAEGEAERQKPQPS